MTQPKFLPFLLFLVLFGTIVFGQTKAMPADLIMRKAMNEAAGSKRNVFIIFHALWCGWCRKMDNAMNDEKLKVFFEKNYVVVHLTVDESKDKKDLENPGADDVRKKYHGEQQGLPYWFVLDAEGNFLADARLKAGTAASEKPVNVGCPASVEEVNYFVQVIKKTSSLNDQQLALIQQRFLKNKE